MQHGGYLSNDFSNDDFTSGFSTMQQFSMGPLQMQASNGQSMMQVGSNEDVFLAAALNANNRPAAGADFPVEAANLGTEDKAGENSDQNYGGKTAFMYLHELCPEVSTGLTWGERKEANMTIFQCGFELNGEQFVGAGISKKAAKQAMARLCLESKQIADILAAKAATVSLQAKRKQKIQEAGTEEDPPYHPSKKLKRQGIAGMKEELDEEEPAKLVPIERLRELCHEAMGHGNPEFTPFTDDVQNLTPEVAEGTKLTKAEKFKLAKYHAKITIKERVFEAEGKTSNAALNAAARKGLQALFPEDNLAGKKLDYRAQVLGKDPKQALHELVQRKFGVNNKIEWEVQGLGSEEGPKFPQLFKAIVNVDGNAYEGIPAASKNDARANAAVVALGAIFGIAEADVDGSFVASPRKRKSTLTGSVSDLSGTGAGPARPMKPETADKHPLTLLTDLLMTERRDLGKAEFDCVEETPDLMKKHICSFTMRLRLGEKEFFGKANSKKLAKVRAARDALRTLFDIHVKDPMQPANLPMPVMAVGEHFAALCNEKYAELSASGAVACAKEIAGFVITTGGTKCLSGDNISCEGQALCDCHAEVLARRGLVKYFYQQLALLSDQILADKSIFEPRKEGGGYKLKDNVDVHLYITSAPCGDARLFSRTDQASIEDQFDSHPNRKNRGMLRVKIENGMGTLPVTSANLNVRQTWDAITGGERLLCMSCSDKILKWNIVGVQGALLSNFVEPIYLKTLVLGSLFHADHLTRSCYARIAPFLQFEVGAMKGGRPFGLNQVTVSGISNPDSRCTIKPPATAMNWVEGSSEGAVEVITQETGRSTKGGATSRLSKRALFADFRRIFAGLSPINGGGSTPVPSVYSDAKRQAVQYNEVKEAMFRALLKANCGQWARKPHEMDDFALK